MRTTLLLALAMSGCVGSTPVGGPDDPEEQTPDGGTSGDSSDAAPADDDDPPEFPDATVTGWTPLEGHPVSTGTITVTTAGAIVEDLDIDGGLLIDAANVTVRHVRISNGGSFGAGIRVLGDASAIIEDVQIGGTEMGIRAEGSVVARRVHVLDSVFGVSADLDAGKSLVVEDSFFEGGACRSTGDDGTGFGPAHLRFFGQGQLTIRHNTFDRGADACLDKSNGVHIDSDQWSSGSTFTTPVVFEDNLLDGAMNACLLLAGYFDGARFASNQFGSTHFPTCGDQGPVLSYYDLNPADKPALTSEWSGNVWREAGGEVAQPVGGGI